MLELKSVSITDANNVSSKKYTSHKAETISAGMLHLILPVLSESSDATNKNSHVNTEKGFGTKACIKTIEGKDALIVFGVKKDWTNEDFQKRLKEGDYNYRLLWDKGDPWWTSQTTLPGGKYRVELVKTDPELSAVKETNEKFTILYNRWKNRKNNGDNISADESYYKMVHLGKQALPYIILKIKDGESDLIPIVSEITGAIPKKATISECIEWWDRIGSYKVKK